MRFSTLIGSLSLTVITSAYTKISDKTLREIPEPGKDFDIHNGALLGPILRVRVPGTAGIVAVRQHFLDFFSKTLPAWKVELQNSTQHTPLGGKPIPFINVIATRDPPWARAGDVGRLALVAHYDSKLTPTGFIGATDSAAPCAMIMHAARSLDQALTKKWDDMKAKGDINRLEGEKGIQLILLDGEEAFVSWTDTDSLYGARCVQSCPLCVEGGLIKAARLPSNGTRLSTQPCLPTAHHSTRYPYSSSSTC